MGGWFSSSQKAMWFILALGLLSVGGGAALLALNVGNSSVTLSISGLVICVIGIALTMFASGFFTGFVSVGDTVEQYSVDRASGRLSYGVLPAIVVPVKRQENYRTGRSGAPLLSAFGEFIKAVPL